MGQHARDYNDLQADGLEDLLDYETGNLSLSEAFERGVVDEYGAVFGSVSTWGVHDVESLVGELDRCELAIASFGGPANTRPRWVSNGVAMEPHEMSTSHLRNAIRYAEGSGITSGIVASMRSELNRRKEAE